jgi:hypothetical protein
VLEDRRNRTCPKCGTGVLPEAVFCIRCGTALPPMAPDPERVARQQEREAHKHVTWFLDLFPGVMSREVLIGSVIVIAIAAALGIIFLPAFAIGAALMGFGIVFAVAIGALAVFSLVCGLSWLMYGELCFPPVAWVDFRSRHWVAFLTLVMAFVVILAAVSYLLGLASHGI